MLIRSFEISNSACSLVWNVEAESLPRNLVLDMAEDRNRQCVWSSSWMNQQAVRGQPGFANVYRAGLLDHRWCDGCVESECCGACCTFQSVPTS
mmetsp:Transcript_24356/g.38288  ORF Transcript_24356/g.38288 Transcript_24356/m.38288 type:complete len:94 (+) Transcript_24356:76-357(+)